MLSSSLLSLSLLGQVYPSPQSAAAPAPMTRAIAADGDGYGFGPWLNGLRARHGLHALACDRGLSADAAANSARGFGHLFMGRARRQNAGVGALAQVCSMWTASPAHASALLDPTCRFYGIANVNGVWTYSAR